MSGHAFIREEREQVLGALGFSPRILIAKNVFLEWIS